EFFLRAHSFVSWSDWVWFRPSHVKHHQTTVHSDIDGEVVLPQKLDWKCVKFFATQLGCDPVWIVKNNLWSWVRAARGNDADWKTKTAWMNKIVPKENEELRQKHRNWARTLVFGHLAIAAVFIATGHWFYIIVFQFSSFYAVWLGTLC